MAVAVGVAGILVGVAVAVGVTGTLVGVAVAVGVVGILVGVAVAVGVAGTLVAVAVAAGVAGIVVAVAVGVDIGATSTARDSKAMAVPSDRLDKVYSLLSDPVTTAPVWGMVFRSPTLHLLADGSYISTVSTSPSEFNPPITYTLPSSPRVAP